MNIVDEYCGWIFVFLYYCHSEYLFLAKANNNGVKFTVQKMSKYGVFSVTNTGKYGPEKTPYLDTFQTVIIYIVWE